METIKKEQESVTITHLNVGLKHCKTRKSCFVLLTEEDLTTIISSAQVKVTKLHLQTLCKTVEELLQHPLKCFS